MATQVGFQLESSLASKHLTDAEYIKGGYIVVKTAAERDALPIYNDTVSPIQDGIIITGSLVYVSDLNKSFRYSGTAWVDITDQGGTVKSITAGTGLTGGTITETGTIAVDTTVIAQKTDIKTQLSQMTDDATHRLVTDTEKSTWNGKSVVSGTESSGTWSALTINGTAHNIKDTTYTAGSGITITGTSNSVAVDSTVVALKSDLKLSASDKTIDW